MYQCYESSRTPKVGRTSTNLYLQLKWDLTNYENHRFNVKTAKTCIDNGAPVTFSHLYYRPKKLQLELERFSTIQRNNKYLMEKIARIQREGAWVDNKNYHEIKSLNIWKRQKEMIELAYNNQTMINRLLDCTTYYNRSKLEDEYLLNQKYKANIQKYPKDWRNIQLQIKLLQKFLRKKIISERTGKYQPGLERRKNKWALEKEAFEIEKAQKAAQEAIETEEEERMAQEERLITAKKFRERKKEHIEASKNWREAREERLRQVKQREKEAKERESEEKRLASEKQRQRRDKAKKELEEWKMQKKAKEAEREALEKEERELQLRYERDKPLEQRRARQPRPGTKKPYSEKDKESQQHDESMKRSEKPKPWKGKKEDSKLTIKDREQLDDEEVKMLEKTEYKKPGMGIERHKSSQEEVDVLKWSRDIRESTDDKHRRILEGSHVKGDKMKPKRSTSVEKEIEESELFDSDTQDLTDDGPEVHEKDKESASLEDKRKKPLNAEETLEGSENEEFNTPEDSNQEMIKLGIMDKKSLTEKEETASEQELEEQEDERQKNDIKPEKRKLLEETAELKFEADRQGLTEEEEKYRKLDKIEESTDIPKIPRDSIKDGNQKYSKMSETRFDKAEKSKEMSDNKGEESTERKDDKKDEESKDKEREDGNSKGTEGKKSEDKKSSEESRGYSVKDEEKAERREIPSEDEIVEDLGKVHIMSEEGKIEDIDLGEVKAESEREALRESTDAEATEEMESPKLTDKEAPKDLGTAHVMTDEGKVEEVNLVEVEDESQVEALRDPTDLEQSEETTGEDIKELGSAYVISDKGTLEKIDLEKPKNEIEPEDLDKGTQEAATHEEDIKESGSAYVISEKGTLEKIDLEALEKESEQEGYQEPIEEASAQKGKHSEQSSEEEDSEIEVTPSRTIYVFGERGSVEEINLEDVIGKKRLEKTKERHEPDGEENKEKKDSEEESKD